MNFEEILAYKPYGLGREEKDKLLTERLKSLTERHRQSCQEYRWILNSLGYSGEKADSYTELPFLPVRLFKELDLKSVPDKEVVKIMTSSGTSGQKVSKIYLDRVTSANQQKTMVKIVSGFIGPSRMPMIIVDCPSVVKNRAMFSARGAGILGFSVFGSKKIYALNDKMELDMEGIQLFLEEHQGERLFLFGFTYMVWQYFYKELVRLKAGGVTFDLSNAVLVHGGGWKKLASEAVSPEEFQGGLKDVCGLARVHDYYGMVEQTGCIYMQCECGHLHASIFSDVVTRRSRDFSICKTGEKGIIQVVSMLPESYPGHSLLTEDEGVILGEDDCPCGRKGKYFKVLGRIKNAEIRGCSDTYAAGQKLAEVKGGRTAHMPWQEQAIEDVPGRYRNEAVLDKMVYLVGNRDIVKQMPFLPVKEIFEPQIIDFCDALSKELLGNRAAKSFPDVVTFGFWLRRAALTQLKQRFGNGGQGSGALAEGIKLGRGVAFHIAPSNVPVNFAYSLAVGLLAGNANVVRVPSKDFLQVKLICDAINKVLERFEGIKPYITLARYSRDREVNNVLSEICDIRVIWGGDATIAEIRKSGLGAGCTEVAFADRYSLAVIDAAAYLDEFHKEKIAQDFYNDTYLSDQNACTSPRAVVWIGEGKETDKAKELFWDNLYRLVQEKYGIQPVQCVDKLSIGCISAASCNGNVLRITRMPDNLVMRVHVDNLTDSLMDYRGNSGYFYESEITDVLELKNICNNVRCQTIGLLGDKELLNPLILSGVKGIDRVVPIGRTMDFDFLWDGYNLAERFTRTVVTATKQE